MADEKRALIPPHPPHLPTRSAPTLPSASGEFAWSPRSKAVKDARYTRAYADLLRAQSESYIAAQELSDTRFGFAVALSKWASLNEVCGHEQRKGYLSRMSELKVLALELETKEINARIARDAAMVALAAYQPQPPAPPPPSAPQQATGLTPSDVQKVAQIMPDMKPETIEALVLALGGFLAEKNR